MAKKAGQGQCVHCGEIVANLTWDHVFPKSWYPDDTPRDIEKWKIPSCRECNAEYGQIEEELGVIIPLVLGPDAPNASGMYQKALRALDASKGRNVKDRIRRAKKRDKILQHMQVLKDLHIPPTAVYPGLEEKWGRPMEEQVPLSIPASALNRLVEKIIKGIVYIEDKHYLDASTEIEHLVITDQNALPIKALLAKHGIQHSRGPGIEVLRAVVQEDGVSALYEITIWGQFVMYASVTQNTAEQNGPADITPQLG